MPLPRLSPGSLFHNFDFLKSQILDSVRTHSKTTQPTFTIADEFDIADTYLFNYGDPILNGVEAVLDTAQSINASIAVAYFGGGELEKEGKLRLHENGIPVFATPERAITGVAAAVDYAQYRRTRGV